MGPPPFGDGNPTGQPRGITPTYSFNGATAFRRWKHARQGGLIRIDRGASMGPPPFGDGNTSDTRKLPISRGCFNGATAFRRWKPRARGSSSVGGHRFNGATAFRRWKLDRLCIVSEGKHWRLQWGHRLSAMETALGSEKAASILDASMGPPPFGDGNLARLSGSPWDVFGLQLSLFRNFRPVIFTNIRPL